MLFAGRTAEEIGQARQFFPHGKAQPRLGYLTFENGLLPCVTEYFQHHVVAPVELVFEGDVVDQIFFQGLSRIVVGE